MWKPVIDHPDGDRIIVPITVNRIYIPDQNESNEEALSRDYDAIEIYEGKNLVQKYGDYYHDQGSVKAEGWIQGYLYANQDRPAEFPVEWISIIKRNG